MMDILPNSLRGEAACRIGQTDIVIAVEFKRLATLCDVAECETMELLYTRLLGFHPKTVMAAIRVLTIHPDGDKAARELAVKAVGELSGADEVAFREAITKALTGHINSGKELRGEADPMADIERVLGTSEPGKNVSPS